MDEEEKSFEIFKVILSNKGTIGIKFNGALLNFITQEELSEAFTPNELKFRELMNDLLILLKSKMESKI